MIYYSNFALPSAEQEIKFIASNYRFNMSCFSSYYPFKIFQDRDIEPFHFDDVTILYGSNGSGKTTILNLIASNIMASRASPYNTTELYDEYSNLCSSSGIILNNYERIIISSDDVFKQILERRVINKRIDQERASVSSEYFRRKEKTNTMIDFESIDSIDEFYANSEAKRLSANKYINKKMAEKNIITQSNGEFAYNYFVSQIKPGNLYLIDEPENSLSPPWQIELVKYIQIMARYEGCQFIIVSHSPFMLSMPYAKIYDLDCNPVKVRRWNELENMRIYYDLFITHHQNFEND